MPTIRVIIALVVLKNFRREFHARVAVRHACIQRVFHLAPSTRRFSHHTPPFFGTHVTIHRRHTEGNVIGIGAEIIFSAARNAEGSFHLGKHRIARVFLKMVTDTRKHRRWCSFMATLWKKGGSLIRMSRIVFLGVVICRRR